MINNFHAYLVKGFVAASIAVYAFAGPAAAMPMVPNSAQVDDSQLLTDVQFQRRGMTQHWNQQMHGNRCRTMIGSCRHFYHGYYYQTPWWTLPLAVGAAIGSQRMMHDRGGHVRWCMSRYRSYDVRSDSWLGNDGQRHRCISSN